MKKAMREKPKEPQGKYLSTGSSLLNLAMSGRVDGGFLTGHYYQMVGDSQSGKTWLILSAFAEACRNKLFEPYRLIYDDVEGGALMDMGFFFGPEMAERLEPPATDEDGNPACSDTMESFYFNVHDALQSELPFIYGLDSENALSSGAEQAKFAEQKEAAKRGRETAGTYGDGKARGHSMNLRKLMGPLKKSGSILIVVSQSRDSFDPFVKQTYSGGRSLQFYATAQMWTRVKKQLKRTVKGRERQIGTLCEVRIRKSRFMGRDRVIPLPIYHSYGIDDIGSMVDWLVGESYWKKAGQSITIRGMGAEKKMKRSKAIDWVEGEGRETELQALVADVWEEIEEACKLTRKRRYGADVAAD